MNTRKLRKAILTLCSALLLVSLSVGMTIAYLTDTEAVVNTFTVGDVEITLDEAKVDEYGEPVENADRVQTNEYKLIPGHKYTKDPTVHVTKGSEPSYIRMIVEITDLADLKAACGADFLPQNFVEGWDPTKWISHSYNEDTTANTATCEFWYADIVDAREEAKNLEALFKTIKVPGTATDEQVAKLADMQIKICAQAIQANGFTATDDGKTAMENAWTAWNEGTNFTPATPAPTPDDNEDNTEGGETNEDIENA